MLVHPPVLSVAQEVSGHPLHKPVACGGANGRPLLINVARAWLTP